MIVLVCGGRDFMDSRWIFSELDEIHRENKITLLIHGAAKGVDTIAGEWAEANRVPCHPYPARWLEHGKAAGPIRNQEMLDYGKPNLVVAFPGGRGTDDMVRRAHKTEYVSLLDLRNYGVIDVHAAKSGDPF